MRGNSELEQRNGMKARPVRKAGREIFHSGPNSSPQRELLAHMEMMSHLGNSQCSEKKQLWTGDLETIKVRKGWITS